MQELRFGDNDTLSALVAALVQADWLVLLTDVDYLYTANPRTNPDAQPIQVCILDWQECLPCGCALLCLLVQQQNLGSASSAL